MKKIMFNDKFSLTQAVLGRTKTQTRRMEAFQPSARMFDEIDSIESGLDDKGRWIFTLLSKDGGVVGDVIPRYNVGEIVAIAQNYKEAHVVGDTTVDYPLIFDAGYYNKMFVKASLMPHHIRITDVKVERLQDISDEDIMCEGVWQFYDNKKLFYISKNTGEASTVGFLSAREAFTYLIDKVSGNGTWESNPWVVAYSFELVD